MIRERIKEAIALKEQLLKNSLFIEKIEDAANVMTQALKLGKKVLFCGNGGSAADAQHLAAELSGRYYFDRPPLSAEAVHVNSSFLTAVANDYSYDVAYARYIEGMGVKGDVLVAISTSGNSGNIIKAIDVARKKGMHTIGLTGATGGAMKELADVLINIPSDDTPRIQEAHILIGHIICEIVEKELFPQP